MFKIGARLWKTGLAVALTVLLVRLTGHPYEVYGAVAAALAVAPSASHSVRTMSQQIGINLLGGIVGSALVLLFGPQPLVIGAAVVIALLLCQQMGWRQMSQAAVTVTLFVMAPHTDAVYAYAVWRLLSVVIGSVVGTAVNALVMPPAYGPMAVEAISKAGMELDRFVMTMTGSLDRPASMAKADVLARAARVDALIAEARRLCLLMDESDSRRPVIERSIKVLASLLERIQIIHKAALTAVQAGEYQQQLPGMQAALAQLTGYRQLIFGRLSGRPVEPEIVREVEAVEQRFESPEGLLPECPDEVEAYFRLYRMRSSLSFMANRLVRLSVAMDAVEPAEAGQTATGPVTA